MNRVPFGVDDSATIEGAKAQPSLSLALADRPDSPFTGDEALNLTMAAQYVNARGLAVRDLDSRDALFVMARKLDETARKIRTLAAGGAL